jgi:MFS family permease
MTQQGIDPIPAPTAIPAVIAPDYRARESDRAEPAEGGSYRWWVVFMLWFVCFLNNGDRQAIASIFPKLSSLYGFDKFQLGLIGSAFAWVYAFGSPVAGYVGDRLNRKNLILGGCFFWSLVAMTTGWCTKLWQFILARMLVGVGETVYFPASMSLISDYHGPRTRSKAMSFHQSSVYAGSIMGSWITAWIAQYYRWQLGFYFFGGCGIALSIVLFAFIREPKRGRMDESPVAAATIPPTGQPNLEPALAPLSVTEVASTVFTKPTVILLLLTFMGANFVSTIFMTWTPTYLVEKFHFTLASAGLSGSAFILVACAFGSPLGGILADHLSNRFLGGRMMVQAAGLLFGSAFVFLIGTTNNVTTLLLSMICFGFGKGLYDSNIFASIYDVVDARARSTAAGLMNTIGWGGGALGPVVVGYVAKHGPGTDMQNMSRAIAYTGIIYIVGSALLLIVAFLTIHRDCIHANAFPADSV